MLDYFQKIYWLPLMNPILCLQEWQATVSPNLDPGFPQKTLKANV